MNTPAQNLRFKQALDNGEITQAQYNQAMAQNTQAAAPMPQETWSQPTAPTPSAQTPNLNSPLQKGILGKNPNVFGATGVGNTTPVINTPTKAAVAVAAVAPFVGPVAGVSASTVLIGEGLSVGINQGFKAVQGGGILTPEEVAISAAEGGAFSIVGGAVLGKAAQIAPRLAGEVANPWVRAATRTGINAGLGAGASGVLTGGNPTAMAQGAGFGAVFGLAGEGFGKLATKIAPSKTYVTEITGGSSKGVTSGKFLDGDVIESSRQFNIETKTSQVKNKSYANYLKRVMKDNPASSIEFEGQGKTHYIVGETMETTFGAKSFKAPAEPFLEAAKNKPYVAHYENLGINQNMIAGKQSVSISQIREGNFLSKGERAALNDAGVTSKVVEYSDTYHSVRLWSEITPKDFAATQSDFNLIPKTKGLLPRRSWLKLDGTNKDVIRSAGYLAEEKGPAFKQMGGLSAAQLQHPENIAVPKIKAYTTIADVYSVKSPGIKIPFGLGIGAASKVKNAPQSQAMFTPQFTIEKTKQLIQTPASIQKQSPLAEPKFMPMSEPKTMPFQTPKLAPSLMPKMSPIQTPRQTARATPIMNLPNFSKQRFPNIPGLGLGGGFDNLGPKGNRSGQWFQKKHKIKTYTQMLNTFGLGKAAKPMRTVDHALSKHINKLDRKIIKRSVKHKRR